MISLTPRQSECLALIRDEAAHGRSPSYAELAHWMGFCGKKAIFELVNGLEERGAIMRHAHHARSITPMQGPKPCPRGPNGEALRFIPFDPLSGADSLRRVATDGEGSHSPRAFGVSFHGD